MSPPRALTIKTDKGEQLTLFQAGDNLWHCPACGSAELTQQPYNELGATSFEICNCFFQIGYDDNPLASSEAVKGIKNNWSRWRSLLLKEYSGQFDKLERLKSQLTKIGINEPITEGQNREVPPSSLDHYHDPLLSRLYDQQNPWGKDCDFYLAQAQGHEHTLKILDLGCGTGLLTTAFAKAGHDVTGVDPAVEMLNIAIRRPYGDKVMWMKTSAEDFQSEHLFDLIILSGHAFQVFLGDEDIQSALQTMKRHLAPKGRIVFDTRNPEIKSWENWTPDKTKESLTLPPSNKYTLPEEIEVWHDLGNVEDCGVGKLVSYNTLYRKKSGSKNNPVKTSATIRFLTHKELIRHLDQAGLVPEEIYGDWDSSPYEAGSREIIVTAGIKNHK
ncbi:class I SAM-dependent DNA methyltransferase [Kiloniella sp.]|uniref:class I SAM-dependent DNA methyltransferase n=1 Tax=Kiloniella sp. TaxID=1938587 RepID=UPI003B02C125